MADTTVETTSAKPQEDWIARRWRPMMGWMYMVVCSFDFVIAPVLWAFLQAKLGQPVTQWRPLTLEGAGLFHISMGAVLGVAAYGRTQEKLGGANNGGIQPPTTPAPVVTNSWGSQPLGSGSGFGSVSGPAASFGAAPAPAQSPGFGAAPAFNTESADVVTGFGGKKAPPPITSFPEK